MKVTANSTKEFSPITVEIRLETQQEVDAVMTMAGQNRTVATVVTKNEEHRIFLGDLLGELYAVIREQQQKVAGP